MAQGPLANAAANAIPRRLTAPRAISILCIFDHSARQGRAAGRTLEHFYLALPIAVLAICRFPRTLVWVIAIIGILASPALRWLAYERMSVGSYQQFMATFYSPTHLRLDGLLLGVGTAAIAQTCEPLWSAVRRHSCAGSSKLPCYPGETRASADRPHAALDPAALFEEWAGRIGEPASQSRRDDHEPNVCRSARQFCHVRPCRQREPVARG